MTLRAAASILQITHELSGQWTIPVLLALESCGGRFTPLQRQLDITPARLSDNLKRMAASGLIQHIAPHERRHPLLPEYVLTDKGLLYREAARAVHLAESNMGYGRLSAKAWNVPVLLALDLDYARFQEIRLALQQVTPGTLSTRLNELNAIGLVEKVLTEQPRPSFLYHLNSIVKKPVHRLASDLRSLV